MAREVVPIEELQKLEKEFAAIAFKLRACADVATDAGMTSVLIHAKSVKNTHLPEVKDWVETTMHDIRLQVNAHSDGRKSKAEKAVERAVENAKRKKKEK